MRYLKINSQKSLVTIDETNEKRQFEPEFFDIIKCESYENFSETCERFANNGMTIMFKGRDVSQKRQWGIYFTK